MDIFFTAAGPEATAVSLPVWIELATVVVGSVAGVLVSYWRKLDLVGFVGLALICGLGGGLIRDVIMQQGGVYMLQSPYAIPASVATGIVGFLFPMPFERWQRVIEWFDILGVGLFSVLGTDKAIIFDLTPMAAILMGTITGIGGGMLRDVFLGEVPHIFRRDNLYAICAVAGAAAYYALVVYAHLGKPWAAAVCVALTVWMRRMSLRHNILSPADVDLTPSVVGSVRKAAQRAKKVRRSPEGNAGAGPTC